MMMMMMMLMMTCCGLPEEVGSEERYENKMIFYSVSSERERANNTLKNRFVIAILTSSTPEARRQENYMELAGRRGRG